MTADVKHRSWQWLLVLTVVAAVGYEALPPSLLVRMVAYDGVAAVSVVAVALSARRRPAGERAAWVLLSAGLLVFLIGDVIFYAWEPLRGTAVPFPFVSDAFYLGCYPLLVAGVLTLIRTGGRDGDRAGVLDALIVTIGFGVVAWVFLMKPYLSDASLDAFSRLVLLAYPTMDLLLLAVSARLLLGAARRPPALLLLLASFAALLVTDAVYGLQVLADSFEAGGPLDIGWMIFYGSLGAAALHPSSTGLAWATGRQTAEGVSRWRLAALAGASLLAPAVDALSGLDRDDVATLGATAALFLLVVARMSGLVEQLQGSMARVAELQRQRAERRFTSLVKSAADLVLVLDEAGRVRFASPSVQRLLGTNLNGASVTELCAVVHPEDVELFVRRLELGQLAQSDVAAPFVVRAATAAGGDCQLEVVTTNLLTDPDVDGLVINARDITERVHLEAELRRLAFHDPLTGLANRALFLDRVQQSLTRAARSGGGVAVVFVDVDDFKNVNDTLGHTAGDQLLAEIGERLRRCVRPGDTVARLGGDEFGVLIEDEDAADVAESVAERCLATLRPSCSVDGHDIAATASLGVAVAEPGLVEGELMRNADIAMYETKRTGKSGWRRYQPSMRAHTADRLQLTADLSRALDRQEFTLFYQPLVALRTHRVVGVEALVRWRHPTRGLVAPDAFIGLAEQTGHIVALGDWVLGEAARQTRSWLDHHALPDRFSVSVNISARQLQDPGLVRSVRNTLASSGLDPARMILELTESVLLRDPDEARAAMVALKSLGLRLAIDDFGTGYSSLSYLRQLPVDIIKIDRSFLEELGHGSVAARSTLVHGILELSRTLRVTTVAEGIHTAAQLADLRSLGCELGQGYFLSRPVPADDIPDLVLADLQRLAG